MRNTLLLTMILLVFAAWAVAQQGTTSPSAPTGDQSQAPQSSAGEKMVEGCLGGSASNLTVTDKAGTTYQLQLPPNADTSKLSRHIGEEVRVTGTVVGASSSGAANPSSSAGTAGSAPSAGESSMQPSINVSKMDKIGDTCSSSPSSATPSK
jgi:hypothetical protein